MNYIVDNSGAHVKKALVTATGLVGDLFLVVIFTLLFMYTRDRLKTFILSITREDRKEKLKMIISRSGQIGDKVNLNPLSIIVVMLIGASVWGVAGMIIFIPLLGVIKIILDNSEDLHPYAYLIGIDNKPKSQSFVFRFIVKVLKRARGYLKRKEH